MKKRTVKDFIALYAPEDEEMLVLIQSGTSADRTFLDTFWTAHTYALAMADSQTGQVISGRCYLSWPLTDKERKPATIPSGLPKEGSTGSRPGTGKATPSVDLSGMLRRYWRKASPVRRWKRSGRSTQSPSYCTTKYWGPSRWIVR